MLDHVLSSVLEHLLFVELIIAYWCGCGEAIVHVFMLRKLGSVSLDMVGVGVVLVRPCFWFIFFGLFFSTFSSCLDFS